ncbi:Sec1-like protein [Pseudocohnilembus persalinus]|uniref:Sec1-like protein n=1 Tax=Pseudocohnilembus persalinus TaxID=266149 RepID=A0A0V0Q9L1_PSEPJ|nr:Sec1-like protein [Pseudocohnilembus persalinus]|eukprot:KRW98925.1 Sec1-like protein [Pseudocohnilembus persalinus]
MEPLKQPEENFSLKKNCQNRIKMLFDQLRQTNQNVQSYLLIVDEKSLRMISSYMKMMDLMELDILAVEQLDNERKKYQKQHAIYFISPTKESVDLLNEDYADKKNYQYGFAHVFFSNRISDTLMKSIANNKYLMERLKTFKEFNQDFMCKFDNIVNLDMPEALPVLYSQKGAAQQQVIDIIGNKLSTVITSLEKFYGVEIVYNRESNKISESIALSVSQRLNSIVDDLKQNNNTDVLDKNAGKVTLFIFDRSIDPMTPLLRDFYYQPMLYDLLDIQNDIVIYQTEDDPEKQKALLSDPLDHLFPRYQYKHIAEVMEGIPEEFQDFAKNNTTAQIQRGELNNLDFNTMSDVIKKMPKYKQLLTKYTMHIKLIQDFWKIFEEKDVKSLGEIEQTLATGVTDLGKKAEPKKVLSQVGSRISSDVLTENDKLRLILLTIMCLDLVDSDRKFLMSQISPQAAQTINNLICLGVNPARHSQKQSKSKGKVDKTFRKKVVSKMQTQTLSLCRHTATIEQNMSDIMENNDPNNIFEQNLPQGKYNSIKINLDEQFGRGANNKSSTSKKKKLQALMGGGDEDDQIQNTVPKVIIFMAGGMSYSEIRAIKNMPQFQNVGLILSGSSLLKPQDYIDGLQQMKSNVQI